MRSEIRTGHGFAIDGVTPGEVVAPATAEAVAESLLQAAHLGKTVAPVGNGTQAALGNPPERVDIALSTANLAGILVYEPTDLVLSVGAGTRLGDVQAVLSEHGQWLPIDPPGADDATIGGLIATALTGPRRIASGSLRDLLIGITVAHASGTVTHAGGMVVKNVSGFDMPRVYHGSLGTLGVIVSANFKVLPRARAEATVVGRASTLATALAACERVRDSRIPVSGLEAVTTGGGTNVAVRIEAREASLPALVDEARLLLGGAGEAMTGPESRAWWVTEAAPLRLDGAGDDVIVRCTCRPRDASTVALGVAAAMERIGVNVTHLAASPALGSLVARFRLDDGSPERLAEVQGVLLALADHATILAAPPAWKRGLDVWGSTPDGFDVMRALKEQFDPHRVLNPGRFAGFI